MDLSLLISGLGIGSLIGIWLTQAWIDWRERGVRRAAYRNRQLKELYAPIVSRVVDLTQRWQLVSELRQNLERIGRECNLVGQDALIHMEPAHKLHAQTHVYQNQVFQEVFGILKSNLDLAESATLVHFANLCRHVANREAVKAVGVPIDVTGEQIPSPENPFSPAIQEFNADVVQQHNQIASELRSGQFTDRSQPADVAIALVEPPQLPGF